MKTIDLSKTTHAFEKQNLVSLKDKRGYHDVVKCKNCGLKGKIYNLTEVTLHKNTKKDNVEDCPKKEIFEYVKITRCTTVGKAFENITPDSIHKIIRTDKENSVWVLGNGQEVRLLSNEFIYLKENNL